MGAISFLDVLKAHERGMAAVNEASLGRAMQHVQDAGHTSFGIVTSWRGPKSHKENQTNFHALQHEVRSAGKGFFKMKGHWQECQAEVSPEEYRKIVGTCPDGWHSDSGRCTKADAGAKERHQLPYGKCPKENLKASAEPSLFVPGITKDHILKLAKKYEQDAVVYAGPETKGKVHVLFQDGTTLPIGDFHPNKIAQAYSTVRGKNFTFEGFSMPAQGYMETLIEQAYVASRG